MNIKKYNKHKFINGFAFFLMLPLCNLVFGQQDKHVDPFPTHTVHRLSFSKHININTTSFNGAKVDRILKSGTDALQKCDSRTTDDQDVGCKVSFERNGALTDFGTSTDGLDIVDLPVDLLDIIWDIITNGDEEKKVHSQPGFVKIVTAILRDGRIILGTANGIPSSSLILTTTHGAAARTESQIGQTFIHEFGHCQGLYHRINPDEPSNPYPMTGNPFMYRFESSGTYNEVNLDECIAYHDGHNKGDNTQPNHPVDILFLIDDTGSMGEEIGSVRNALTKFLSNPKYSSNPCDGTVFQLATYKDNVTIRPPTTDLNTIKSQVASLTASGGGDCPEASAQAFAAIKGNVKDGGLVMHATDASPHAGTTAILEESKAALTARKVKISTILSGDCSPTSFFALSDDSGQDIPFSDNHDPSQTEPIGSPEALAALPPNPSAIEAFSFMSEGTGGVFVFMPEVNTRQPSDLTRYENVVYNTLVGGVSPAITSVQPVKAPKGGTIALTIKGSNTHFNSSTILTFNDAGIEVKEFTTISPTEILATIKVGLAVPLGFKDIKATSDQGAGVIETAEGIGLLEIVLAPSTPTILSISPASGTAGQTLMVKVTGINTNFGATSVLDLGSGITILNSTALNKEELTAQIKIDPAATIGFRNVRVTTGTEVATENVPGPFLVVASNCAVLPTITAIEAAGADAFCNSLQLTALYTEGSNPGPVSFIWTYAGNPVFDNSPFINLSTANPDGIYSVVVKDVNDCTSEPFSYSYQSQNVISSYTIYAFKEAGLGENNLVNGSVGVRDPNGKAEFKKNSSLPLPGFVKASEINVNNQASVPNQILQAASGVTLPTMYFYSGNTTGLPNFTAPANSNLVFGNAKDVKIKKNAIVTLTGNNYGKIEIEKGAEVTFSNNSIDLEELKLHNGDDGDLTKLLFISGTNLRVGKKVDIGDNSSINPTSEKITFYLSDSKPDEEHFTVHGKNTSVIANLYMPKGKLKVQGGNDENCNMTGLFIAEKIESDGKNVIWNGYDCGGSSTPVTIMRSMGNVLPLAHSKESSKSVEKVVPEGLEVSVMPNPSASHFYLKIQSNNKFLPATVRITDIAGRTVNALQNIQVNTTIQIGNKLTVGSYFVEVVQGNERKILKLIRLN